MRGFHWRHLLIQISVIAAVVLTIFPFGWMAVTSVKTVAEIAELPIRWVPAHPTLRNYARVFAIPEFRRGFLNSTVVALGATTIGLTVSVMAGYGFARFSFPGRRALMFALLSSQFFPVVMFLVPFFLMLSKLRLLNTLPGLILAHLVLSVPLATWLMTGFFSHVPKELDESAMIDGCTRFGALLRILLPATMTSVMAVGMFLFIQSWQEYLFALVFTRSPTARTLPVVLSFFVTEMGVQWGELMAASAVATLPVLVAFIFLQRYFVSGLLKGALSN